MLISQNENNYYMVDYSKISLINTLSKLKNTLNATWMEILNENEVAYGLQNSPILLIYDVKAGISKIVKIQTTLRDILKNKDNGLIGFDFNNNLITLLDFGATFVFIKFYCMNESITWVTVAKIF